MKKPIKTEDVPYSKHPEVIAWDEFQKSANGVCCLANAAEGRYLKNRLESAFHFGFQAAVDLMKESVKAQ